MEIYQLLLTASLLIIIKPAQRKIFRQCLPFSIIESVRKNKLQTYNNFYGFGDRSYDVQLVFILIGFVHERYLGACCYYSGAPRGQLYQVGAVIVTYTCHTHTSSSPLSSLSSLSLSSTTSSALSSTSSSSLSSITLSLSHHHLCQNHHHYH